jgi:hypothetical protein
MASATRKTLSIADAATPVSEAFWWPGDRSHMMVTCDPFNVAGPTNGTLQVNDEVEFNRLTAPAGNWRDIDIAPGGTPLYVIRAMDNVTGYAYQTECYLPKGWYRIKLDVRQNVAITVLLAGD